MELYYTKLKLPTGVALAAATGKGVTHLELKPPPVHEWLAALADEFGDVPAHAPDRFNKLSEELSGYFAGKRKKFTVKLDVHGTPFQEKVWAALKSVRYGSVITYGALAKLAGSPDAARAVGGAMHANRVPIIIPCHRVVASGGSLGGYGGGLDMKRMLLGLEGVRPPYV